MKYVISFLALFIVSIAMAQPIPEDAVRSMARGEAAFEAAKSPSDYSRAYREFKEASLTAPDWPNIHFNLGLVQEKMGKYAGAINSYRTYLSLAPNAQDAIEVQTLIYKLEYHMEADQREHEKLSDLNGIWSTGNKGTDYQWRFVIKSEPVINTVEAAFYYRDKPSSEDFIKASFIDNILKFKSIEGLYHGDYFEYPVEWEFTLLEADTVVDADRLEGTITFFQPRRCSDTNLRCLPPETTTRKQIYYKCNSLSLIVGCEII